MTEAPRIMTAMGMAATLPRRKRPSVHAIREASLSEVASSMRNGDGLWYRGNRLFSMLIRIATASVVSHAGLVVIDGNGEPQVGEVVEGAGGRLVPLRDAVEANPGRWYWAPANRSRFPEYNGLDAATTICRMVGCKYGWWSIYCEAMWYLPGFRKLSYWRWYKDLDRAFVDQAPFCSTAVSIAATDGGVDPCPGRAPQWTTPQDTYQSWLWSSTKTALYP